MSVLLLMCSKTILKCSVQKICLPKVWVQHWVQESGEMPGKVELPQVRLCSTL